MKIRSLAVFVWLVIGTSIFSYMSCSSGEEPEPVDCDTSDLALSAISTNPTSCAVNDGMIMATVSGGEGPFKYALDNSAFGSEPMFSGLGAGTYVLKLKDKNGCERSSTILLKPVGSTLTASVITTNSGCKTSGGSLTINAAGGTAPYTYKINTATATSSNTATSLAAGSYTIKVTDDAGCSTTQTVRVTSGIRLSVEVKAIIDANCAVTGCHVSGGAAVSFTMIDNIIASASQIKSKTQSGEMPKGGPALSLEKLNTIACWVDDGAPNN